MSTAAADVVTALTEHGRVLLGLLLTLCLAVLLVACSDESGDRDLAGATTGPGVEIHCAGQQKRANLERFPKTVGDTNVDVTCQGTTP
jgi:hypothetical protein